MATYIHGSTDPREVARLEKQARFTASFSLPFFDAAPGMRVLDLATGVGAMAGQLLQHFPGIDLTGMDLRESQLASARKNHPEASYVQGDATHMPFASQSFDRVHCSWLLEHVQHPVAVLQEVRRVLKPQGVCTFIEVDNATFRVHPPLPEVEVAMHAMNQAQQEGGGDPFIGPKLAGYFKEAGFTHVDARPVPIHANAKDPARLQIFMDEFAEIFESLDEALGPERHAQVLAGANALRSLAAFPDASIDYTSWLVRAEAHTFP